LTDIVTITDEKDYSKLEGWLILRCFIVRNGQYPELNMILSHPVEEKYLRLKVWPDVMFGRSGNVVVCNEILKTGLDDVDEAAKKHFKI